MANILLGVTGSVAAIRTPALYQALQEMGHQVKVLATQPSLYFFDPAVIGARAQSAGQRDPETVVLDSDEWPGRETGYRWQRGDPVVHIDLRKWAEVLLIAPIDANTLAKLAHGLCDNCLTCVWRAWDSAKPVILAPAMNTLMLEHPLTRQHLHSLASLASGRQPPPELSLDDIMAWINEHCARLHVIPPQIKQLACGDIGKGAMAEVEDVVRVVQRVVPAGKS